jgi:hypothetical protein
MPHDAQSSIYQWFDFEVVKIESASRLAIRAARNRD